MLHAVHWTFRVTGSYLKQVGLDFVLPQNLYLKIKKKERRKKRFLRVMEDSTQVYKHARPGDGWPECRKDRLISSQRGKSSSVDVCHRGLCEDRSCLLKLERKIKAGSRTCESFTMSSTSTPSPKL